MTNDQDNAPEADSRDVENQLMLTRLAEVERLRAEFYGYDVDNPPPMERVARPVRREDLGKDDANHCPPAE